jgi:UDP-N-acetylglucosamine 2-epimerase
MPISRALRAVPGLQEVLVHTGQHYDYKMSQTFFDQLGIPSPDYNLEVGSGRHGRQTAEMLIALEEVLLREQPDWVIIRGDTNSTLAGALAASKLHIPLAHVEAGERSFERRMPEEINRLVADRVADRHFCVSQAALRHLEAEGLSGSSDWVGDVMLDALCTHRALARQRSDILKQFDLLPAGYALVTLHRAATTDVPERLQQCVRALNAISETIVFPVHPRTRQALARLSLPLADHVRVIEPVGYFDMLVLEENARLIATDSGGVQREAYYLERPCLTLRDETEWTATVEVGWNKLVGVVPEAIVENWFRFAPPAAHPPIYGDGTAGERIADLLVNGADRANRLSQQIGKRQTAEVLIEGGVPL